MNTEMLSPELQLNNMLEQINAQLPNNKAQKVSEIMNSVLGGEMLLRHVGFFKALGGLGDKIKNLASGEGTVAQNVVNNVTGALPESLQPLARAAATAITGGGTQELTQAITGAVTNVLPEQAQGLVRGAATALQGGGTEGLTQAVAGALPEGAQGLVRGAATALQGGGTEGLTQAVAGALPEGTQGLARAAATALQGGGTQELQQGARQLIQGATTNLPEGAQPLARAAASALTGGGTQELEQGARELVQQGTRAIARTGQQLLQETEQTPGFLDRMVSGLRDLGGRIRGPATRVVDETLHNLDDPSMNISMDDPFSEGPLEIDLSSRRGLFRFAPEIGAQDSGQNIGNAFSQARAQGELPDLPIFDGMREVPQSSQLQEQQAAANREFTSEEPPVPTEQLPPVEPQVPAEQLPPVPTEQLPPVEQTTPATQQTGAPSAEVDLPAVVPEAEEIATPLVQAVASTTPAATGGAVASTVAKASSEVAETGFEFGPLVEGAAILGAVVPQLVSLFEKPETMIQSYVGDQIGL